MEIQAVIISYQSAAALPACLRALHAAGIPALVVDNASTDDSARVAEAAGARVVVNEKNLGFGAAANVGVRAVEGAQWCLILNPDAALSEDAGEALSQAAREFPEAAIIAPKLVEPDGRVHLPPKYYLDAPFISYEGWGQEAPIPPALRPALRGDAQIVSRFGHRATSHRLMTPPEGAACVAMVSGACMLVRRDWFLDAGGFDEHIFLFYEDDDVCRRVRDAGLAVVYTPHAVVHHGRGKSSTPSAKTARLMRYHQAWSKCYVAWKYGLPSPAPSILFWQGMKCTLALLLFSRKKWHRHAGSFMGAWDYLRGKRQ